MKIILIVMAWRMVQAIAWSEPAPIDYPQSLHRELAALQEAGAETSTNPQTLVKVSHLYFQMGDDLWTEPSQRISAYLAGAHFARRALDRDEANAIAHFLYAANTGNAANLQGITASARVVLDLKTHIRRALELQPDHAPSHHMMGMMLEGLPWILGGNSRKALDHLKRAVTADPSYAQARLDLAKLCLKNKDFKRARQELEAILHLEHPNDPYGWTHRYRPEAERLLADFSAPSR